MKKFNVVLYENKTYEFIIEADSKDQATKRALCMMIADGEEIDYKIETYVDSHWSA